MMDAKILMKDDGATNARVGSVAVVLVGCLALAGWIFGIDVLKSILPGAVTMKANTAIGFLLAGVSLWLALRDQTDRRIHQVQWRLP